MSERPLSDDLNKSIARLVLNYGQLEYTDVCRNWRSIESKAQGTVAIAGIFIAGTFAVLAQFGGMPSWATSVIVGVLFALVGAVLCSLCALFVSEYDALDDTSEVLKRADQVLSADSEIQGKAEIRNFVDDLAKTFARTNAGIHRINRKKANWVLAAQTCLAIGVVAAAVIIAAGALSNWK